MTEQSLVDLARMIESGRERWLPVHYFGLPYEVSDAGRVRRTQSRTSGKAGHILKQTPDRKGYAHLTLCAPDGKRITARVATLVCTAFHGPQPTPGHEVAHKNGDRRVNGALNLAWKTHAANELDKRAHSRGAGSSNPNASLTEFDVIAIRALLMTDRFTKVQIAALFGVSDGLISHIEFGRAWSHLGGTPWFQPTRIKKR